MHLQRLHAPSNTFKTVGRRHRVRNVGRPRKNLDRGSECGRHGRKRTRCDENAELTGYV